METEDHPGDGMSRTVTTYSGERHICARIDTFQNGLARFTMLPAHSDTAGEKVKILKELLFKP